jgi:hypothetical protein
MTAAGSGQPGFQGKEMAPTGTHWRFHNPKLTVLKRREDLLSNGGKPYVNLSWMERTTLPKFVD